MNQNLAEYYIRIKIVLHAVAHFSYLNSAFLMFLRDQFDFVCDCRLSLVHCFALHCTEDSASREFFATSSSEEGGSKKKGNNHEKQPSLQKNLDVSALLIAPRWRLRFLPFHPKISWNTLESINKTKLIFTAWSGSGGRKGGDKVDVSMPYCCHQVCALLGG